MNTLIKANKQLLAMLNERLGQLESREESPVDYRKIPSKGQGFFYRSETVFDSNGAVFTNGSSLIKTQQDAAFVATDLFIFKILNDERENPVGLTIPSYLKFTASSSGRRLTESKDEVLWTSGTTNTSLFEFGVPFEQLTPLYRNNTTTPPVSSCDYHYKLPVEYLIPRGAVVEASAMFTNLIFSATPADDPIQNFKVAVDYALGGYKVFGA